MYLFKLEFCPDICPGVGFLGHDICTLPCVKQTASGNLLYRTGGSAQYSRGVRWVGGEKEVQEGGDICVLMADSH